MTLNSNGWSSTTKAKRKKRSDEIKTFQGIIFVAHELFFNSHKIVLVHFEGIWVF